MEAEKWVPVSGFESAYEVSNHGRLKSLSREVVSGHRLNRRKILPETIVKLTTSKDGYVRAQLKQKPKRKAITMHRLVALHFIPNPDGLPVINHKDLKKSNNYYGNLEWTTQQANTQHGYDETGRSSGAKGMFGAAHPRTKAIEQIDAAGNVVAEFQGQREAERKTGFSNTNICKALKTGTLYNGFTWRYKA